MLLCNLYTYIFCKQLISICYGQKIKKMIYYYPIACQFFLQCHNINIKNQSTPGAHAIFPVGGAWTHLEGCAMQSLLSENVYENERVGSYGGYAQEHYVISMNALHKLGSSKR